MSFKDFLKSLNNNEPEGEIIKTIFVSAFTSFFLFAILYFLSFQYSQDVISKYGFFIFFVVLSYAFILPSVRYVRAYREFLCMPGMMIGMTVGMISSFLPGFFIGATNGMFIGSAFGMALGLFFGIWNGKCCGVMGIMEGVMAGFMGGLMGAMTAVMALNDHLILTGIIIFLISAFILTGLNYMMYKETRESERKHRDDEFFVIFLTIVLTSVTLWLMILGPRSFLFGS